MKKIPNPTVILSVPYRIEYPKEIRDDKDDYIVAQYDPADLVIRILNRLENVSKEQAWMHEILHGICRDINLVLTEKELDTLANTLYDTFTRNKVDFSVKR